MAEKVIKIVSVYAEAGVAINFAGITGTTKMVALEADMIKRLLDRGAIVKEYTDRDGLDDMVVLTAKNYNQDNSGITFDDQLDTLVTNVEYEYEQQYLARLKARLDEIKEEYKNKFATAEEDSELKDNQQSTNTPTPTNQ